MIKLHEKGRLKMKIHYFQRYHEKENVATANTILLLSCLYSYSSNKFFKFLDKEYFNDSFDPELIFTLQEKGKKDKNGKVLSIPDATITQEGFKIVVETKLTDWFEIDQLMNHLESFDDQKHKVLITLSSELMKKSKLEEFNEKLKIYNDKQRYPVIHINTTFELLANAVRDVIDDRDYEMQDVLNDYLEYCYEDKLIPEYDSWKYLRMQLAGTTFDFNFANNIYYDRADRGFRPHTYLGLYKQKSIRCIGKICARITAVEIDGEMQYKTEMGELTQECKALIEKSIIDARNYGYDLRNSEHRFFFVEKFYETDFKKTSPGGSMGTKIFDLTQYIDNPNSLGAEKIAELLKNKSWQ